MRKSDFVCLSGCFSYKKNNLLTFLIIFLMICLNLFILDKLLKNFVFEMVNCFKPDLTKKKQRVYVTKFDFPVNKHT